RWIIATERRVTSSPAHMVSQGLAVVGKGRAQRKAEDPTKKTAGGGLISTARCFFNTLFRLSARLLINHPINFVFPDNGDQADFEKLFKLRFPGQNLFVFLATTYQSILPKRHSRFFKVLINPHIDIAPEDKDLISDMTLHWLGRFIVGGLRLF